MTSTRTRSTYSPVETRASSSYNYQQYDTADRQPVRRAQTYPWWIWTVAPLLTIAVVDGVLFVV